MTGIYRSVAARRAVLEGYRTFLEQTERADETTVPTRHGETFVRSSGPPDAPPVILLHGAGSNTLAWAADFPVWSKTHRLHAVDVLGEPGLSAESRPALDTAAHAEWLDDVLAALGVTSAAFAGISLGGWLATDYALRRPEKVTRLALVVPAGIGRQRYRALAVSLLLQPFGRPGRRRAMNYAIGPTTTPMAGPFADYVFTVQRSYQPRLTPVPRFTDAQLRTLIMPVLTIAGAADRMFDSQDTATRLHAAAPHSTVTLIPGNGHLPTAYQAPIHTFLMTNLER
ncbi:alpha/beta fold hydrolase [Amycolatopsis jiangsuensis]|uniref:Pimeloyl-ACP methyl ester carboxylesterase n=1 Tax=Amycolatopsis jiangsuensis TaxID=1181879 RepID=A0A840J227_9PSEU|nr:alpha/beta hydrolase [Amycolatopsis jiangsuensis]MBB4687695.1 pimeloyl-ACP methyl ester carboxylesterase [Amycolatopsis jiangsuensis]